MTLILPERYQPTQLKEKVEVAVVPEPKGLAISREKTGELAAELQMFVLSSGMMKEIEALGLQVESIGTARSANGMTLFTQTALAKAILKIVEKLESGDDVHVVANSLAKLANSMIKATALMKKDGGASKAKTMMPVSPRFIPGQPVAAVNIQINNVVKPA